jgi:tRNA pseudouridine55 synthase
VGLEVECSAGTYVRQLVAALGDAYCEELERTRIGPFRLEDADPDRPLPLAEALAFLPARELDAEGARRAGHGAPLALGAEAAPEGPVRLVHGARLLAVAEAREGALRPLVVFPR